MATRTLILGGGFGGITLANSLRAALPKTHQVVLVDQSPTFRIGATKTWLAIDHPGAKGMEYRRDNLKKRGIIVIEQRITAIDAKTRRVTLANGESLVGDHMVIALGADFAMGSIPGLAENAHTFYSVEGALKLREKLKTFEGGQIMILVPKLPFKCPPAPYEAAMLFKDFLERRRVWSQTKLGVWTVEGLPMGTAGPEMGNFVKTLLSNDGITFNPLKKTVRVETDRVVFEDGEARFDLLIAVPPHVAPSVVKEAGLLAPNGWISVDPLTLGLTGHKNVYAIGDVTAIPLPGRFRADVPLSMPKAGTAAEGQAKAVAERIAANILGLPQPLGFNGNAFCYLETGDMHAVRGDGHFYAMPSPIMTHIQPDMQQYEAKKAWVRNWIWESLGIKT